MQAYQTEGCHDTAYLFFEVLLAFTAAVDSSLRNPR